MAVDFPGHGKSDEPPTAWGVPEYAKQVIGLLDELGLPKVDLVAHSFGGRVAIWLGKHHPERIGKMVLTGSAGIRKPLSKQQEKRQNHFKRMNRWLRAMGKCPLLHRLVERCQSALRKKYGSPDYQKLSPNMRQTFVKVIGLDLYPLLADVKASTLLIWGGDDTETPLWMGQQMEQQMKDAGLIVFDRRTHFAFIEEWERFLLIVKQFFFGGQTS